MMEITNDQIKKVITDALIGGPVADYKLKTNVRQYVNVVRRAGLGEDQINNAFNTAIRDLKYERKIALVIGRETKFALTSMK